MWTGLLVVLTVASGALALDFVLVHTNDMHARIEEISQGAGTCRKGSPCYGGFARVKTAVDRVRAANKNVLFLNAGDNFQGTPYYTFYKWEVISRFVDLLGIDAMSLGNHEFDDGVEGVAPYLKHVKTPSVCCNIDTSAEPDFEGSNLFPWVNFTIDGTMIGVIGYLTPETEYLSQIGKVKLFDEVDRITKTAKIAKEAGAQIIIAVGHSGFDIDKKIGQEVEDVDVVVGGHTNTFLYTGTPPDIEVPASTYPHIETQPSGKKVPVVQAFAFTKYLGYLELKFDDSNKLVSAKGNPILLNSDIPQDKDILAEVQVWKKQVDNRTNQVVGRTRVDLFGRCRMAECNLGNLVTDSWVDYATRTNVVPNAWTKAPIAILNGGAIRTGISFNDTKGGDITAGMVLTVMPFENQLMVLTMNGSVLLDVIEQGVREYDQTGVIMKGSFLQVSGLRVVYNMDQEPGRRVVSAQARCGECSIPRYEPVEPSKIYNVITTSFLAEGGDNFPMLTTDIMSSVNLGDTDSQTLIDYLSIVSPVYPGIENRITLIQSTGISEKEVMDQHGVLISTGALNSPPATVLLISILSKIFKMV